MKQLINKVEEQFPQQRTEYENAVIRVYRIYQVKRLMAAVSKQNATSSQRKVLEPMINQLQALLEEAEGYRDNLEEQLNKEEVQPLTPRIYL